MVNIYGDAINGQDCTGTARIRGMQNTNRNVLIDPFIVLLFSGILSFIESELH